VERARLEERQPEALLTRREQHHARVLVAPPEDRVGGAADPDRAPVSLERAGHAIWVRGADDPALRWCYEHARVVLFPTREEGFGLPLLEAMTFHAPVVASDELALREVSGGAATVTHVGADDAAAWRAAIEARAAPRSVAPPSLPSGAITWDEHTERLLAVARRVATA
jgi:glycosyltransferase involved in cell wall biosynthesis